MSVGKVFEYGLMILVAVIALRWITSAFSGSQDSPLTQTWSPGVYPNYYGGGAVYFSPGLSYGGYNPYTGRAPWRPRRGYNG